MKRTSKPSKPHSPESNALSPSSTSQQQIEPSISKTLNNKRKRNNQSDGPSCPIPWPNYLTSLQTVYQALNTIFTFCSARKHLHTTIDNMRSSVESLMKAPLELESIAQIKTLLPHVIRFVYVEREALGALEKLTNKQNAFKKGFEIYSLPSESSLASGSSDTIPQTKDEVLLFQFIDGELKSSKKSNLISTAQNSTHSRSRPKLERPSVREMLMPTYSPKVMTKMIEKRNLKFKQAVDELLAACAAEEPALDPVQILIDSSLDHIPYPRSKPPDKQDLQTSQHRLQHYLQHPEDRPTIESLLSDIKADGDYREQIVEDGERKTPSREALFGQLDQPLSPTLSQALLATKQIRQLYSHQAEAINHLASGSHVIVSTSTSSGKSLVYQIPMLQALEQDPVSCGLYIFPTKALAQDQRRALQELLLECGKGLSDVKIATFDGDTPRDQRPSIREQAKIIFTNPDMIHLAILPHEELWRRWLQNLRLVVVDELHIYSGHFGSHMAYLMRRLRRICEALGNDHVQFVSCSATIENPLEHMQTTFGLTDVKLVSQDGSPAGAKQHVIWNPALVDELDVQQGRVNAITDASRIFRLLISQGIRTIVFCKIRRTCELMFKQVKDDLALEHRKDLSTRVRSYRAGYTATERRAIEQEMHSGDLLGIIATTALELGIDIGSLDAVLSVGFPRSVAGWRQQAGRAGRRQRESLAILLLDNSPSNQAIAQNPQELFDAPGQKLRIDLGDEPLLAAHLQCAAHEMPVQPAGDEAFFGSSLRSLCATHLVQDSQGYFHPHPRFQPSPSQHVSIRAREDEEEEGADEQTRYALVDISEGAGASKILEEIERSRIGFECHLGAIYLHQGQTFEVVGLDHKSRICKVKEVMVNYQTRVRERVELEPARTLESKTFGHPCSIAACYGIVKVSSTVYGYVKVDGRSNVLDTYELEPDLIQRKSRAIWFDLLSRPIPALPHDGLPVAIHGAIHALVGDGSLVRCDCRLGGTVDRLVVFGSFGRSAGLESFWESIDDRIEEGIEKLSGCNCQSGCQTCLGNLYGNVKHEGMKIMKIMNLKFGALVVLNLILGREWKADEDAENENDKDPDPNRSPS